MAPTPETLSDTPVELLKDKNRMLDILSAGAKDDASKQMIIKELNVLSRTQYHIANEFLPAGVRLTDGASFTNNGDNGRLNEQRFSNEFVAGFLACYDFLNKALVLPNTEERIKASLELPKMVDRIFAKINEVKAKDGDFGKKGDDEGEFYVLLVETHKIFRDRSFPKPYGF